MRGVNRATVRGFTGADAEVFHGDGFTIANVRLATDEGYMNRNGDKVEHTEWHSLVFKNALAEVVEKYITKGSHIEVVGRLRTESWEDENGNTRYNTKIHVTELYIVSTPNEEEGSEEKTSGNSKGTKARSKTTKAKASSTKSTGRKATKSKASTNANNGLPY